MAGFLWKTINRRWLKAIRSHDANAIRKLHSRGYPFFGMKESVQEWLNSLGPIGLHSSKCDEMASTLADLGIVNGLSGQAVIALLKTKSPGARRLVEALVNASPEILGMSRGLPVIFVAEGIEGIEHIKLALAENMPKSLLDELASEHPDVLNRYVALSGRQSK